MEVIKDMVGKGWVDTEMVSPYLMMSIKKSENRVRLAQEQGISVTMKREGGKTYIKFEKIEDGE